MPSLVRAGGAWRDAKPYVRVGGIWREVVEAWVRVSGVWRTFYVNTMPPVWTAGTSAYTFRYNMNAFAAVSIEPSGAVSMIDTGTDGTCVPAGATVSDYEAKWVRLYGDTPANSGWPANTYVRLGSGTLRVHLTAVVGDTYKGSTVRITVRHRTSLESITVDVVITAERESGPGGGGINPV